MKKFLTKYYLVLSVLLLAGCLVAIPACGVAFKSEAEKAQALSLNDSQSQQVAEAQATALQNLAVAKAASDEALAKRYQQEIDVNKAMQAGLAAQHKVIETTPVGESFNWGAGLTTFGGLLPPPFNALVMLGGLIGTAVQTARKNAAVEVSHAIVNSIDVAKAADPAFDAAVKKAGPAISAELAKTSGAHEFVESARV